MKTILKVSKISKEDMLNHIDQGYNPSVWDEKIKSYLKYRNVQFYTREKSDGYNYMRFYVSYIVDGLYIFKQFNAYHSVLSGRGFCKVTIDEDGNVDKFLFTDSNGNEGYAENCNENRKMFADSLTPRGIMVSNCI